MQREIKVGIGFATGRKHFQRVLRSYICNWKESGLVDDKNISLNLFIAYDLSYEDTKESDYTAIDTDILECIGNVHFIGVGEMEAAKQALSKDGIVAHREAPRIFGRGYASQRNIILYYAIKHGIDYLLFLDDDEYPFAVTKNAETALWSGQHLLKTHLRSIENADITYGYHCGYISPIPNVAFSDTLGEEEFRMFIQAISNDIIRWDTIKKVMLSGGVTYADTQVLTDRDIIEVQEVNRAKFISGSNLCINLTEPERVYPFFNPPGARGEDTFLSTCLSERRVLRVPGYAFHDGFSAYNHLLCGALPLGLKPISADGGRVVKRFLAACIGWVRYKPLLLYITERETYAERIRDMTDRLGRTLPQICEYFDSRAFLGVMKELKKYDDNVEKHYAEFNKTKEIWSQIMKSLA
jgi:hypothetical protein